MISPFLSGISPFSRPHFVPGGGGGIALIAHTGSASGDTSSVTTSAINTTGANFLVVAVSNFASASAATVTDSKGNTWTPLTTQVTPSSQRMLLYYSVPTSAGAGHTFTATGTVDFPAICVQAFSVVNTSPFESESGDKTDSSTTHTSLQPGSLTPSMNGSLIITGLASFPASFPPPPQSIDSGFTITDDIPSANAVNFGCALAYLIQGTAGAVNPTWTTAPSSLAAAMAVFKPI